MIWVINFLSAMCILVLVPAEGSTDAKSTTRYNVYKELYESECKYVAFLQVIVKVFMRPLQL